MPRGVIPIRLYVFYCTNKPGCAIDRHLVLSVRFPWNRRTAAAVHISCTPIMHINNIRKPNSSDTHQIIVVDLCMLYDSNCIDLYVR